MRLEIKGHTEDPNHWWWRFSRHVDDVGSKLGINPLNHVGKNSDLDKINYIILEWSNLRDTILEQYHALYIIDNNHVPWIEFDYDEDATLFILQWL